MTATVYQFLVEWPLGAPPYQKYEGPPEDLEPSLEDLAWFENLCETQEPAIGGNIDNTVLQLSMKGQRDRNLPYDLVASIILNHYMPRLAKWDHNLKKFYQTVSNGGKYAKGKQGGATVAAKFQEFAPVVHPSPTWQPPDVPDSLSKNDLRLQMMVQREMLATEFILDTRKGREGESLDILANYVYALRTEAGEKFRLNDFSGEIEFEDRPFWRDDVLVKSYALQEEDEIAFKNWFSNKYKWKPSAASLWEAVFTVAQLRRYHPVKEYLNALVWDGEARLERVFIDTLGCTDTPLNREIGKRTIMSAVQRILMPGCKQDHVPMLESAQGFEKSKWVEALGAPWSATGKLEQGNKDTHICLKGNWIVELPEFDGVISKQHFAWMKGHISTHTDNFRAVYAKTAQKVPRESIFIATINPSSTGEYLKDSENRRFWPVTVKKANLPFLALWRDQYFAEAMQCLKNGEKWWITDEQILKDARIAQNSRRERDLWCDILEPWCANREESGFSLLDVLSHLGFEGARIRPSDKTRLYAVLHELDWAHAGQGRWTKAGINWEVLR